MKLRKATTEILNLHSNRRQTRGSKMNESEIVEQLKEVNDKLEKIETFFAHDGLSVMLNEKLTAMTKALVERIDRLEKALIRKD